ncbi:MAG: hypothetical protein WBU92_06795 [Candidatus Dormiibacterota bacterium]
MANLTCRIYREPGALGPLVDAVPSGDRFAQWDKRLWEQELTAGLRMRRLGADAHLIAGAHDLPVMLSGERGPAVEMTDGTSESTHNFREGFGLHCHLARASGERMLENYGARGDNRRKDWWGTLTFASSNRPPSSRRAPALAGDTGAGDLCRNLPSSRQLATGHRVADPAPD